MGQHGSGLDIALMPGQRLGWQHWRLKTIGFALRPLEIVFEHRPETRMRAALDDQLRPLLRAEPAKIRQSLLGDENLHILGNMIDMAYKRHKRRDRTALCGRRRHEDRDKRSEEHTSELQSLMRTSYAV